MGFSNELAVAEKYSLFKTTRQQVYFNHMLFKGYESYISQTLNSTIEGGPSKGNSTAHYQCVQKSLAA